MKRAVWRGTCSAECGRQQLVLTVPGWPCWRRAKGRRQAAKRLRVTPAWVLFLGKYGNSRPALQRFECASCHQRLRPSKFGMADMYTRKRTCAECARQQTRAKTSTVPALVSWNAPSRNQGGVEELVAVDYVVGVFESSLEVLRARLLQQREL